MSVYEIVTNKIIDELEKGNIPWRKPWRTEGNAINQITRKAYRGINSLLLSGGEYLTFKQITELNGKVKKGEKSHLVVFWKQLEIENDDGEQKTIPLLRYYNVFSIHQTEGINSKLPPIELDDINPIEKAENIVTEYTNRENIKIINNDINGAFYRPSDDIINLPKIKQFENSEKYYSTAFHEMAHSTGHEKRLNRLKKQAAFGSESYSKEELVAEISSAYMCEFAGLDTGKTIENTAAYINSWKKRLKEDSKLIVLAAGAAEKATEYILSK